MGAAVYAYSLHTAILPLPAYDLRLFAYSATDAYALDGHGCFLLFADGCLCLAASFTSSPIRRPDAYGLAAIFY